MKRTDPANGIVLRRGVLHYNRTIKGVREWHNLQTMDMMTAIQRKAELLKKPEIITAPDSIPRAIKRYIQWKLDNEKYRPISARNAMTGLKRFMDHVGKGATVASVRAQTIQKWYDEERERGMGSTANRYLLSVQAMFQWAVEIDRSRHDNPVKGVKTVKAAPTARIRYTDRETRDKLIAAAPDDHMRFILYAGFHAGLRLNEISEARVFWFDLKQGLLHVQATPLPRGVKWKGNDVVKDIYGVEVRPFRTKGKKDRTVPLTKSFWEFLKVYLTDRSPEEFVGVPERTVTQGFYRWPLKSAYTEFMTKQKVRWISPHIMRHTFSSLLVMKGVSLHKVANWLGDTLVIAEKHYAHLAPLDADIQHLE